MAVGNAGRHLESAADALCTFLSTDGGATWSDVAPHAGIYEYGDHGGALLLAKHETDGPTDALRVSTDGGLCWHDVRLAEAIDIQNIRVEPRGASHVFVVHGRACPTRAAPGCTHTGGPGAGAPPGKMYVVDVKSLMGASWRECGEGDYEAWAPRGGECVLGANATLERRKPGAACFNGRDYVAGTGSGWGWGGGGHTKPAPSCQVLGSEARAGGEGARPALGRLAAARPPTTTTPPPIPSARSTTPSASLGSSARPAASARAPPASTRARAPRWAAAATPPRPPGAAWCTATRAPGCTP